MLAELPGTSELVINGTPYVAAYAITETAVRILRVLHGAQEWPDTLPTNQALFWPLRTTGRWFELVQELKP